MGIPALCVPLSGLEPETFWSATKRSIQLSHRGKTLFIYMFKNHVSSAVPLSGLEPETFWSATKRSIQLSHRGASGGEAGIRTLGGDLLSPQPLSRRPRSSTPAPPQVRITCKGGGSGIRTHGNLRYDGFQDRCLKPLGHPSRVRGSPSSSQTAVYHAQFFCQSPIDE